MCYKRISKDEYYLNIALAVSKRSTCINSHYGCVIVKDDVIVATGYNGSVRGEENCCDRGYCKRPNEARGKGYDNCDSVHAEQNALLTTSIDRLKGSTVYLACERYKECSDGTFINFMFDWVEDENPLPCSICYKMLRNAGIERIVNRSGDVYRCL